MKLFNIKKSNAEDLSRLEMKIIGHVRKRQPVLMGEVIKDLRLSHSKGRHKIMGLLSRGLLKYSGRGSKISG